MKSQFQENQRYKLENLIENSIIFNGVKGNGFFMGKPRKFVLENGLYNVFEPIRKDVIDYFTKNNISWWGGGTPSGHILSSQIACINFLFLLRKDKQAVLSLIKSFSDDFIDVLEIPENDESTNGYIQFEAVSKTDHLNEKSTTRGSNCTSIDALMYALHKDGKSKWIIPIEWKYTEHYNNQNKALEGENNCKGDERLYRYTDLINQSRQLKNENHQCYYFEPFYQLMRQTLWAEKMIEYREKEFIDADDFLHIHIIPKENDALLKKIYPCSKKNMEDTWRQHLNDQVKYRIISPEDFIKNIDKKKYKELLAYLATRYF